jgi:RimJ/RimL family protein N-acetyltransferase
MFMRTARLTLRPGWIEDAPELFRAIAYEAVISQLDGVPWPYRIDDAREYLTRSRKADEPGLLILTHRHGTTRLIGQIEIHREDNGDHALGYWLTPDAWGQGYAAEAGRAMIANARDTLRLKRLTGRHFVDNPASGRVLRKLGFRPTGEVVTRNGEAPSVQLTLDLANPVPEAKAA